jgi:hypothetical protein
MVVRRQLRNLFSPDQPKPMFIHLINLSGHGWKNNPKLERCLYMRIVRIRDMPYQKGVRV